MRLQTKFLQSQWPEAGGQSSVKTKTYNKAFALESLVHDFLQLRLDNAIAMQQYCNPERGVKSQICLRQI